MVGSWVNPAPATLPEPSFKVRGWSVGVTGAVSASDLHVCERVGPQGAGGGSWIADLYLGFDRVNGMQI